MRRYVQLCKTCRHNFHGVCAVARNTFSERPCAQHDEVARPRRSGGAANKRRHPPESSASA